MSVEYPTDEEVRDFLRSFVAPPVITQIQEWATEEARPLRKMLGALIEGAWADQIVKAWIAEKGAR